MVSVGQHINFISHQIPENGWGPQWCELGMGRSGTPFRWFGGGGEFLGEKGMAKVDKLGRRDTMGKDDRKPTSSFFRKLMFFNVWLELVSEPLNLEDCEPALRKTHHATNTRTLQLLLGETFLAQKRLHRSFISDGTCTSWDWTMLWMLVEDSVNNWKKIGLKLATTNLHPILHSKESLSPAIRSAAGSICASHMSRSEYPQLPSSTNKESRA